MRKCCKLSCSTYVYTMFCVFGTCCISGSRTYSRYESAGEYVRNWLADENTLQRAKRTKELKEHLPPILNNVPRVPRGTIKTNERRNYIPSSNENVSAFFPPPPPPPPSPPSSSTHSWQKIKQKTKN